MRSCDNRGSVCVLWCITHLSGDSPIYQFSSLFAALYEHSLYPATGTLKHALHRPFLVNRNEKNTLIFFLYEYSRRALILCRWLCSNRLAFSYDVNDHKTDGRKDRATDD